MSFDFLSQSLAGSGAGAEQEDGVLINLPLSWTACILSLVCTCVVVSILSSITLIHFLRNVYYLLNQMSQICTSVAKIIMELTQIILDLRRANLDLSHMVLAMEAINSVNNLNNQLQTSSARLADELNDVSDEGDNAQGDN